jgi:hypothetical protein
MAPSYTISRAARAPVPESGWSSADWRDVTPATVAHFHPRSSDHCPRTDVKMLHSDEGLHVHVHVTDRYVRVAHVGFQAPVFRDSCAECFVRPGWTGGYLNFEMSADGSLLASFIEDWTRTSEGFRRARPLEPEWDDRIPRFHSLAKRIDPEITGPVVWSIQCTIPWSLFIEVASHGRPAPSEHWTGNFYKCGDETSHPHWASWSPIGKQHAGREFTLRVQRTFDRAHFLDSPLTVELLQELLFERVTSDAVFGQRCSAHRHDAPGDVQDGVSSLVDISERAGYDVRVHVTVRDVTPKRVRQPVSLECLSVQRECFVLPFERDAEIPRDFFDVLMHAVLGGGHRRGDAARVKHGNHAYERLVLAILDVELD